MSDDERIARLAEIAQRVDPRAVVVQVTPTLSNRSHSWAALTTHNCAVLAQATGEHALEAALLVLAGEPPAWVEQLANEWEQRAGKWMADHEHYGDCDETCNAEAKQVLRCATELRARAKGKP